MVERALFAVSLMLIAASRFSSTWGFVEPSTVLDSARSRRLSAYISIPADQAESSSDPYFESDFWGSTDSPRDAVAQAATMLPCVPSLDAHGELPRGAYTLQGDPLHSPKETCRVCVALDSAKRRADDEFDIPHIVRTLQDYLEDGLQTFQVKAGPSQHHVAVEEEILGRFLTETPGFARDQCCIILPLRIPLAQTGGLRPGVVRRQVTASLRRLGTEAIDCLQLQYRQDSPYYLDILDALEDLKRDGLVRSVSSRNLPPRLVREAAANGFSIDSSQLDVNLLDPTGYSAEQRLMSSDLGIPLVATSPLAGALLSDKYRGYILEPLSHEMSLSGYRHVKTTLRRWNGRSSKSRQLSWRRFHQMMLPVLADISLKYRVSIATVCLRWVLQQEHVASTAVSFNLFEANSEDEQKAARRIKAFRDVFKFELDEEDVHRLWEISGVEEPTDDFVMPMNEEDEENPFDFNAASGLFLP
jgi:aryl-alcohol dehydrogenase-like predicted oxidoreductase